MNASHLFCTLKPLILAKTASKYSQLMFTIKLWTKIFDETF